MKKIGRDGIYVHYLEYGDGFVGEPYVKKYQSY